MKKLYFMICAISLVVLTGCKKEHKETNVNIFIAASLSNAMNEIRAEYEKENSDTHILFNADSSGTLEKQIEEGADCDLFFSAAEDKMDQLAAKGYIEADSIYKLLTNQIVLIKHKNKNTNVTGFQDIAQAKNIALAAEDVPAGAYAREIFRTLGIYDQVMNMEINEGSNVTEVLTAVSEESNEVGVVYKTDAMSIKDSIDIIAEADKLWVESPVVYPVALVKSETRDSSEKKAAEDFLEFLLSKDAKTIFEKYGFQTDCEG